MKSGPPAQDQANHDGRRRRYCLFGGLLGTSTVTTYVESTAGSPKEGRTGLTAVVVGILLLLALFCPLAGMVPGAATAPALIIVGVLMMGAVTGINFGRTSPKLSPLF